MRNLFLLSALVLGFGTLALAQKPDLKFKKTVHDFGEIKQHEPVNCEFTFTNTGSVPITITKVKPSCGCTTPEWPKSPILPGKTGTIKAQYNAAAAGSFNKSIQVHTDQSTESMTLRIKGTVVSAPIIETNDPKGGQLKLDGK